MAGRPSPWHIRVPVEPGHVEVVRSVLAIPFADACLVFARRYKLEAIHLAMARGMYIIITHRCPVRNHSRTVVAPLHIDMSVRNRSRLVRSRPCLNATRCSDPRSHPKQNTRVHHLELEHDCITSHAQPYGLHSTPTQSMQTHARWHVVRHGKVVRSNAY